MKKLIALVLVLCMLFSFAAIAETSDEVVKIGCILPLTGGSAYIGQLEQEGVDYCAQYYNSKGGINGKKIEVVYADSTGVADVAVTELERLITVENVVAVTGPFNSTVAVAMAPICEKYQVPFVVLGAASLQVLQQGYTYTFRPGNTANTNTDALLGICDLIEAKFGDKIENAAILYANGEWGVSQSESFNSLFADAGMNVVFNETFEAGTSDFSSIITKLKNSGAQVMIPVIDNFSDAVLFARQMKEYKANTAMLACGGVFVLQEFIDTLGEDANLIFSTDVWNADFLPMRGEEAVALHQGYIDQYGYKMGEQSGMAWVAAVTLFEGMANSESLEGADIKAALLALDMKPGDEGMEMIPYDGIRMNEETSDGQFGQNVHAFSMASQVIDGQWRAVFPDNILADNPLTWPITAE